MPKKSASSEPHRLQLTRQYETADQTAAVYTALEPEVGAIPGDRSTARLNRTATQLVVTIDAADLSALRAANGTWTALLQAAESATAI